MAWPSAWRLATYLLRPKKPKAQTQSPELKAKAKANPGRLAACGLRFAFVAACGLNKAAQQAAAGVWGPSTWWHMPA
jgi:hypothetical protein